MAQVNNPNPDTVRRHFGTLYQGCGLPVVVQNYPVASGVTIRQDVLASLIADCPYVAAVKCEAPPTAVAISVLAGSVPSPSFGGAGRRRAHR